MKLIVNVDDFGLTRGISKATLELAQKGIIRSTTVLSNMVDKDDLMATKKIKSLSVGLHFTLDTGPASFCKKGITGTDGWYLKQANLSLADEEYIRKSLDDQYAKLNQYVEVTHLDSHHHIHLKWPLITKVFLEFSQEKNIFIREAVNQMKTKNAIKLGTRAMNDAFYGKGIKLFPQEILNWKKYDVVEMMSHPGFFDKELSALSSYAFMREQEIGYLIELKDFCSKNGIKYISYKDL